ncbi:hypothetical protein L4D76_09890 [Photobacterium sagamiensis]|uniref:plasmid mobilization protein n=1 Tax=Photobacterium sagamiensis TaxID=2910241 RepID=UPI003D0B79A4
MTKRKYKKKDIGKSYLSDPHLFDAVEYAIETLVSAGERITQKRIAELTDTNITVIKHIYPYFAERKTQRIELRCSVVEKMQWQQKAQQADMTVSRLASQSLNNVTVSIPPTQQLRGAINRVVVERVSFNTLINQLAKWVNTYKSSADELFVVTQLKHLCEQFDTHDKKVMTILGQDHQYDEFYRLPSSPRQEGRQ